jgi:tight adherence protein B
MLIAEIAAVIACLTAGFLATNFWVKRRESRLIRSRLEGMFADSRKQKADIEAIVRYATGTTSTLPGAKLAERLIVRSGAKVRICKFMDLVLGLLVAPPLVAFAIGAPIWLALLAGAVLAAVPYLVLAAKAEKRRVRFMEQLPDAIDLIVSVLRSGLSVPQAIKSAGEDMSDPCGTEFDEILQRMNLGQSLPDAIRPSVERYQSFELDLIARAVAVQLEVGGSLAELLEKTNSTLRQRLRLKRQVAVLTAQSRLSGLIISIMPFVIAIGFSIVVPGYLQPLTSTNVGRMMLVAALVLQLCGILAVRRLSTFKV